MPNRLAQEKSPYLRQHEHNPVHWWPWEDAAFEQAKQQDKLVFCSIGYATCHWCHVMAHESFEDEEVAEKLNQVFISIKVDREERPDIDHQYMAVCQLMTGRGGWPLTVILTPDKQPVFAGTYFPKQSRQGRMGILDLADALEDAWRTRRQEVLETGLQLMGEVEAGWASGASQTGSFLLPDRAAHHLLQRFDSVWGGFSPAPKFPTAHNLLFLMQAYPRTGKGLDQVVSTLISMRKGGFFDQVGFGFHRYSTDDQWKLPHFEKMLYDQALLLMAYTQAFELTQNPLFKTTCLQIAAYVDDWLTHPQGGFYSAEDADSEGEEGMFYTWTLAELTTLLTPEELAFCTEWWQLHAQGNFLDEASGQPTGRHVVSFHLTPNEAFEHRLQEFEPIRVKLDAARKPRVRPSLDHKILCDWNALMIAGLAKLGQVMQDDRYLDTSKKAFEFVTSSLVVNNQLYHRFCEGEVAVLAQLDDVVFLSWASLSLFQATCETAYLDKAVFYAHQAYNQFFDAKTSTFWMSVSAEWLRPKAFYDGAIPSGNAVMLLVTFMLADLCPDEVWQSRKQLLMGAIPDQVALYPFAHTMWMMAVEYGLGPGVETQCSI